ncbi:MAG TPA: hypothetical protein VG148_04060 [Pyrinomonadaceae bacterium]|nr:hypothetical protein [Pyrinomonadaceae bacterium]
MKFYLGLVVLVVVLMSGSPARAQGGSEAPLTNASVVKLVRAGFREKTVIAIIRARPARFDLAPERLIELKKGGVSERIILAMLAREQSEVLAAEDWEDDGFFEGGVRGGARPPAPGGTDIFGSSGGASGRSRSNGGGGGVDNDTQTTGSATVRILRPPTEAGGAGAPKLERTPTLTNDSVVELVEAGFSEGTIIRRIEQSPVEFDLAPARLEELRKRRVTEPVIAAMRAAMGEETTEPARPER